MPDENPIPQPPDDQLSARDAADFLGITTGRLDRLRKNGKIPARRDGWFAHRYGREDLMAYAERAAAEAAGTMPASAAVSQDGETPPLQNTADEPQAERNRILDDIAKETASLPDNAATAEDLVDHAPIVRMVNIILVSAIRARASEIHLEPNAQQLRVRLRVDGLLVELMSTPKHIQSPIFNRFKVMADLNPFIYRPQTGTIPITDGTESYYCRTSCVPSLWGDKIVIRLYEMPRIRDVSKLGFFAADQATIEEQMLRSGLLLIVGPPGSGTTTTAYALIHKVNNIASNTVAFEQERSYRLRGVTHVYADSQRGRSLHETLPVLLEQNPDTLFLGDIDDPESAALAIDAAEQGVRVWTTLHASDTVRALLRLKHLGITAERISGVVNAVCAQRLARRICESCKVAEAGEKRRLRPFLNPTTDSLPDSLFLYRGTGCDICQQMGYQGLVGIFEILQMTEEFRYLFVANASPGKLMDVAERGQMTQLRYDFGKKAHLGVTTVEEGYRVL